MAEPYTPTTEEVMRSYSLPSAVTNPKRADERFAEYLSRISIEGHQDQMRSEEAARRWLAAHDAQVRAEALREAADRVCATDPVETALSGVTYPIQRLRSEADRIADTNQRTDGHNT